MHNFHVKTGMGSRPHFCGPQDRLALGELFAGMMQYLGLGFMHDPGYGSEKAEVEVAAPLQGPCTRQAPCQATPWP